MQTNTIENIDTSTGSINKAEKIFSIFFSYLFHPIFVPIYVAAFLLYIHPYAFAGFSDASKKITLFIIGLNLLLFPLLSVLLLKALGFIESIFLKTQKDRIIPYIAIGIFFFWTYTVFREQSNYPLVLTSYVFGIFLAASIALIANIYLKISMHAIGVSGWLTFFVLMMIDLPLMMFWPVAFVLLITGLVCSARLITKSHQPIEIYLGIIIGAIAQLAAAYFVIGL
jgi:hypothetical protein